MDKMKVLIVDDEIDYLTLMKEYVERWGYEVFVAQTGKEALVKIKKELPQIVITDYLMPGMDGIAILKEIRRFDQDLEVIMFTAHPDIKNIKGAKELGVTFFVPKLNDDSLGIQETLRAALDMTKRKINNKIRG